MNRVTMPLPLIGFMGAGKSAVGRELSRRIGWPRHDTDEMIRAQFGISDSGHFHAARRAGISRCGTALLKTLRRGIAGIVVTGGGIVFAHVKTCSFAQDGPDRMARCRRRSAVAARFKAQHPPTSSTNRIRARVFPNYCENGYRIINQRQTNGSIHAVTSIAEVTMRSSQ
jgi:hypothetical protein